MSRTRSVDVSAVPTSGYGTKSPLWWGTAGFMVVEGMSLALCAASYIYLSRNFETWPPPTIPEPALFVPTLVLGLLFVSSLSSVPIDRAAKRRDRDALVRWLTFCALLKLVILALRIFEFDSLNVSWYDTAYGSAAWFTLGFHTTLLAADFFEAAAFALIFRFGPVHRDHYEDADEVTFYTWFLFLTWIPLYVLLYLSPRWF